LAPKIKKGWPAEFPPSEEVSVATAPIAFFPVAMAPVKSAKKPTRDERRLETALIELKNGVPVRAAAAKARVAKSTLHDRAAAASRPAVKPGRLPDLTQEVELSVVALILKCGSSGAPLSRIDVLDAIALVVSRMPHIRQRKLRFKGGRPGAKFLRGFVRRHASVVRFGKTRKQEAVRFQATNADVLTTHAAALEKLITENGIDAERLFNLDECGATPGKDVSGQTKEKVFTRSGVRGDARMPSFVNCSRVTIVPTISAAGSCCAPLFIFKGTRLKTRVVSRSVGAGPAVELTETIADLLPRNSIATCREDVAGMDKAIFIWWARDFVKEVADLTSGGRKILLTYDGYRSHLAVEALEILVDAGVIVHALPAHTSGSTQPLDVAVFGPFKQALNDTINSVSRTATAPVFDEFDFALMLKRAYEVAFTPDNIRAGFRQTGMWPIDPVALLRKPLPASANNTDIVSVQELGHMLQEKREAAASELGVQQMVIRRGFLDTSAGLNLTQPEALNLARDKENAERAKGATRRRKAEEAYAKEEANRVKVRREREHSQLVNAQARYARYQISQSHVIRPLALRRAIARRRTAVARELVAIATAAKQK
jgi:hypothetical protein